MRTSMTSRPDGSTHAVDDRTAAGNAVPRGINAPLLIALGSLLLTAALYWPTSLEIADIWQDTVRRRYTHGWFALGRHGVADLARPLEPGLDPVGAAARRLGPGGHRQPWLAGRPECRPARRDHDGLAGTRPGDDLGRRRVAAGAAGCVCRAVPLLRAAGVGADQRAAAVAHGVRLPVADPAGGHSRHDGQRTSSTSPRAGSKSRAAATACIS